SSNVRARRRRRGSTTRARGTGTNLERFGIALGSSAARTLGDPLVSSPTTVASLSASRRGIQFQGGSSARSFSTAIYRRRAALPYAKYRAGRDGCTPYRRSTRARHDATDCSRRYPPDREPPRLPPAARPASDRATPARETRRLRRRPAGDPAGPREAGPV